MDVQTFYRELEIERQLCIERECLDRLFEAWLDEALLIDGFLPPEFVEVAGQLEWAWRWEGRPSIDRAKEAAGQAAELANNTTTLAREYAAKGKTGKTSFAKGPKNFSSCARSGLQRQMVQELESNQAQALHGALDASVEPQPQGHPKDA